MQQIVGFTPWRNRAEPYDYSKLPRDVQELVHFYQNHAPAEWAGRSADRAAFETIWPGASAALDQRGVVPENYDPSWVMGTVTPDQAAGAKRLGLIFGCDPIVIDTPDPKPTPLKVADMTADDLVARIREVVRAELAQISK